MVWYECEAVFRNSQALTQVIGLYFSVLRALTCPLNLVVIPDWSEKMCPASSARITELLANWGQGNVDAREALIPLVYDELRRIARRHLWRQRPNHTLQSAALVNEAYLRLVRQESPQWQNRTHFFGVAAQAMRQILVDYARSRLAAKRGAGAPRFTLDTKIALPEQDKEEVDLVALDDALNTLSALDPRQSRIIELRFFGGLSIQDTAVVLKISPATVKREWTMARMYCFIAR